MHFFVSFFFLTKMMMMPTTTIRWVNVEWGWVSLCDVQWHEGHCMNVNLISSDIISIKKLKHLVHSFFLVLFLSLILFLLLLLISIYTNCPYLHFQLRFFFILTRKKDFLSDFNTFVSHDNGNRFLVLHFLLQNIFVFFKE